MPPPVQNRLPRPGMPETDDMAGRTPAAAPMGPAMAAGIGGNPRRRAAAQLMRGGNMPF
jgi:hypothetical protein